MKPASELKRIVVRGTNWVGDAIMTIPALRELRRIVPDAHITLVTRSWTQGIFADADFLDDILVYDRERRFLVSTRQQIAEWKRRKFDAAILLQNAFEAAIIARLAKVPVRVGYPTDGRGFLLTEKVPLPTEAKHEVYYYLNIVAEFERILRGSSSVDDHPPRMELPVSAERLGEAASVMSSQGVAEGQRIVALCPGSTNSRAKRWPVGRFAALGDRLIAEMGAAVVLVGAADELPISQEVAAIMRHKPVVLTGATNLAQAVAVLGNIDLLVTNDTGPAHIAAALGRPVLVIFGPTDPTTTRPFGDLAVVIRHPPDCAPCMLRDCPIDHRCMTAISPDEIFDQAMKVLSKRDEK
ncbi:MAG: lipopolysaccharide heptosyltransferase II [Pyrinomonadaceae bacterium]